MPAPKKVGRSDLSAALAIESIRNSERNDCCVHTVAAAFGVPYEEAHAAVATFYKRVPGKGTFVYPHSFDRVAAHFGFAVERVSCASIIAKYPGRATSLKHVTTHHPQRFPEAWADGETYVLFTKGHMLAIVAGVNHDWSRGRSLQAYAVLRVRRVNPA